MSGTSFRQAIPGGIMDGKHLFMQSELDRFVQENDINLGQPTRDALGTLWGSFQLIDKTLADFGDSPCLVPDLDSNGGVCACAEPTVGGHAIQEATLRLIAEKDDDFAEVFPINLSFFARNAQNCAVRLWHVAPYEPRTHRVTASSGSTRGFACSKHDNDVFELVEKSKGIQWPDCPYLVLDESQNSDDSHLAEQLFLLSYRAVLQDVSIMRSVVVNSDIANAPMEYSAAREIWANEQLFFHSNVSNEFANLQNVYDLRRLGLQFSPMVHHVVRVQSPIRMAFTIVSPVTMRSFLLLPGFGGGLEPPTFAHRISQKFFTLTFLPVSRSGDSRAVFSFFVCDIPAMANEIDLRVSHLRNSASDATSLSWWVAGALADARPAYVNLSEYNKMRRDIPDAIRLIEEQPVKYLIETWYERMITHTGGRPFNGLIYPPSNGWGRLGLLRPPY